MVVEEAKAYSSSSNYHREIFINKDKVQIIAHKAEEEWTVTILKEIIYQHLDQGLEVPMESLTINNLTSIVTTTLPLCSTLGLIWVITVSWYSLRGKNMKHCSLRNCMCSPNHLKKWCIFNLNKLLIQPMINQKAVLILMLSSSTS